MPIESLKKFEQCLAALDAAKGEEFLDAFYAALARADTAGADAEIASANEILGHYGFEPRVRTAMIKTGRRFLHQIGFENFGEENLYESLPVVNRVADSMDKVEKYVQADELIDYFALRTVILTPIEHHPSRLSLSEPMAKAKAQASHVPEGYKRRSRFAIINEGKRTPAEVEIEGQKLAVGYCRDGIMMLGVKSEDPHVYALKSVPPRLPSNATYQRLRDSPLRGIMVISYVMQ